MNTATTKTLTPSASLNSPSRPSTGRPWLRHLNITVGTRSTASPTDSPDPEIASLNAQIRDLEYKLALYRRREQLAAQLPDQSAVDICAPIIQAVCDEYQITPEGLRGRARPLHLTIPRHVALALCYDNTCLSSKTLGRVFSHRDSSTVFHSIAAVRDLLATDPRFAAAVARIRESISLCVSAPLREKSFNP